MLKARIDMDFTRTDSAPVCSVYGNGAYRHSTCRPSTYKKCGAVALAIVFAFICVSFGDALSETGRTASIPAQISERGSLTSCIENADVASEIEITGSSMKKAIRRVSGWVPKGMANDDDNDDYCALTLA